MDAEGERYFAACLVGVAQVFGVPSNSLTKGIQSTSDANLNRARAYVVFFLRGESANRKPVPASRPMPWGELAERMQYADIRSAQEARDWVERDPGAKATLPVCAAAICGFVNFLL